jgi:hypothetical protein
MPQSSLTHEPLSIVRANLLTEVVADRTLQVVQRPKIYRLCLVANSQNSFVVHVPPAAFRRRL